MQSGFCFQGCKSGAKWSTLYTELPKAEKTGNMDLRPESHVSRIEHNTVGKVTGVVYFDKDGKEQRQKARIVCVAGNSIETPRLLLLSASSMFKDGLANSSGQVGRNYMRHNQSVLMALSREPNDTGVQKTLAFSDYDFGADDWKFQLGLVNVTANSHPDPNPHRAQQAWPGGTATPAV